MTTQQALDHYGGDVRALAAALGIWHSAVYQWGEFPPALRQLQLERLTGGELTAEPNTFGGSDDS